VIYSFPMILSVILIALSFAAKQKTNVAESDGNCGEKLNENGPGTIFVKIEEDEYAKIKKRETSQYIGVCYVVNTSKYRAYRRSKYERKTVYNGYYDNEELAAHASDTLARKLTANGEQGHKLNFPNDDSEVFQEKKTFSSQFVGVVYKINIISKWQAKRHSKHEKKDVYSGSYDNEATAARASDTLARKLIAKGEKGHKLNFPNDNTEVLPGEKNYSSKISRMIPLASHRTPNLSKESILITQIE